MIIGIDYSDPRPDWAIEFAELAKLELSPAVRSRT